MATNNLQFHLNLSSRGRGTSERNNDLKDLYRSQQPTKRSKSKERATKDDSSVDSLFTSLYTRLRSPDETSGHNVPNDSLERVQSTDSVEREFVNFINSWGNENKTTKRKGSSHSESQDEDSSWEKMMQGAFPMRPQSNEDELSSALIQSPSESMTPMYSSIPYSIPIPIMMQMPMTTPTVDKKMPSSSNCMKIVEMCKEESKKGQPDANMMLAKYSNEATGGNSKKYSDSNSGSNQQTSECGDKKNLTSVYNKVEEVMQKTMKNYVDKMMSSKVEKAMKAAMGKMKSPTNPGTPTLKNKSSPTYPMDDKTGSMMEHMSPPIMETNYMTDIMLGMMNMDKPSGSKCPCSGKSPGGKKDAPAKGKYEIDDRGDTDDSSGNDEAKPDDEMLDEGYLINQVKEAMNELMTEAMKETMNQMMLQSYPS